MGEVTVKSRMIQHSSNFTRFRIVVAVVAMGLLAACTRSELPATANAEASPAPRYLIGPGDQLEIFVWRNPEVSTSVPVRPDGRISVPLIEDLVAVNKTPTQLARDIERQLGTYIQNPLVTVIVTAFVGPFPQQVRVIGEATEPRAIPYRANMSMLDVMIAVGGITDFAAGNRAVLVRSVSGQQREFRLRLDDLVKGGDITANIQVLPGDVVIIPESWF
jgi:polysaccharide export outer membrane protein